jgi:phenylalanyl-tRNA synthetase alpha chain
MLDTLEQIRKDALAALEQVQDQDALLQWRGAYLGKKSPLMEVFTKMRDLGKEERPLVGQGANKVRQALEVALEERKTALKEQELQASLQGDGLDISLPGRPLNTGRLHHLWRDGISSLSLS